MYLVDSKPTSYGLQHRKSGITYHQFQEKGRRGNHSNLRKRKVKL